MKELVDDDSVMNWVVRALSDLTLFAKEMDFQIRQPLAAYFRGDPETILDREEAIEQLSAMVDAWAERLKPHFALLDRLHDLITHVERKRPWTFRGYSTISQRSEITQMRAAWRTGYERSSKAREAAAPVLKSGRMDSEAAGQ